MPCLLVLKSRDTRNGLLRFFQSNIKAGRLKGYTAFFSRPHKSKPLR